MQHGSECAEAYVAYRKAMECVDNNMVDAKKCYKVCQWTRGQPERELLEEHVRQVFGWMSAGLFAVFLGRGCRGLQQAYYVFATDDASTFKQMLHQLHIREPESSDEELELCPCQDVGRLCAAQAPKASDTP